VIYNQLYTELESDEGKRLDVYRDHLGNLTVGIGHRVRPHDRLKFGQRISESQCMDLFYTDVDEAIRQVEKIFPQFEDNYSDNMQHVLINMMFNLGASRFGTFRKFIAAIKTHFYNTAADEMVCSKWYAQVPNRAERLRQNVLREGTNGTEAYSRQND
jgi:lysozyme